jgi:chalcone synthase/acridone synthase
MKMKEAHIAGTGTALPYPVSTERFLEVDEKIRRSLGQRDSIISKMRSFTNGTGIHTRHYSHPLWLPEDKTADDYEEAKKVAIDYDIYTPNGYIPPYWQRMKVFSETAVKLAVEAARKALKDWGGRPEDITHVITTCTSGWSEPGIAVAIMRELGLPDDCQKAELNFNGCFCGATCLRLARDVIRAGDAKGVLVVAAEVASSHYDVTATDLSSLVAHSLFADGAAAMVLAPEGQWKYTRTGMSLVPDSTELLGLVPPMNPEQTGYKMTLNKEVGKRLGLYFKEQQGRELLKKIYPDSSEPKPALGIHPGGPNILDHVGNVFQDLGWEDDALESSYDTLQSIGNLGSAAMMFVLARRLDSIKEDRLITMAFGPGVTVEWATLEKV